MKKHYRELYLFLTAMAFSAVLLIGSAGQSVAQEKAAAAAKTAAIPVHSDVRFVLGTYSGHPALYREGQDRPFRILDTELRMLPEADRSILEAGITADTEEELLRIMEDYDF